MLLSSITISALVSLVGFVAILWLATYLATQSRATVATRCVSLSMLSLSGYLAGSVIIDSQPALHPSQFWVTFGIAPLTAVLWFHGAIELAGSAGRWRRTLLVSLYVAALALALFCWSGRDTLQFAAATIGWPGFLTVSVSSWVFFWVFGLFTIAVMLAASLLLTRTLLVGYRTLPRSLWTQYLFIWSGSLLCALSVVLVSANNQFAWGLTESYLLLPLLLGFATISYPLLNRMSADEQRHSPRRILLSFIEAAVILAVFVAALYITRAPLPTALAVIGLAVVFFNWSGPRLLAHLPVAEESGRAESGGRPTPTPLASSKLVLDLVSDDELADMVLDAMRNIYPPTSLLSSPLVGLDVVERRSRQARAGEGRRAGDQILSQDRANQLTHVLGELVEHLKDGFEINNEELTDEWGPYASMRYYLIRPKRTLDGLDRLAFKWRQNRAKQYHAKLKECERAGVLSIARGLRELEKARPR